VTEGVVSLTEEAARVGIARRTAQRLADQGLVEVVVRVGRARGVRRGALDAFVGVDRRKQRREKRETQV
jgi:hypothetical protein